MCDTIADSAGAALVRASYSAYGVPRDPLDWSGAPSATPDGLTRQGYTAQTVLGRMGLLHMNGRVHDAVSGTFISADPFIPDPTNTQSFNRYAYVYNNPLTFTDPSGFSPDELPSCFLSMLCFIQPIIPRDYLEEDDVAGPWVDCFRAGGCRGMMFYLRNNSPRVAPQTAARKMDQKAVAKMGQSVLAGLMVVVRKVNDVLSYELTPVYRIPVIGLSGRPIQDLDGTLMKQDKALTVGDISLVAAPLAEAGVARVIWGSRATNAADQAARGLGWQNQLFKNALQPFNAQSKLTNAGRALTKHPELVGATKDTLRQTLRTDGALNQAAQDALKYIIRNGTQSTQTLGRYGEVTQIQIPGGFGARWNASGDFIGFINP